MEQDLRLIVLGSQPSEKASVINSILNAEVQSDRFFLDPVRRDGEINERKITLINTTSWWKYFILKDLPEVVQQELVCSVFLCPPGPHVFLLVIDLSFPFTEEHRVSTEEHVNLFGERVWDHIIVIFTQTVSQNDKSIEKQIQGETLQKILHRCGDRYHIFDTEYKRDEAPVDKLLVKIDDLVAGNNGKHFKTDDEKLLEIQRKRDEDQEKAKTREIVVQKKRELLKEKGDVTELPALRVVLLGWIFSGKSSAGNNILNKEIFDIRKEKTCAQGSGDVNGRKITVLDTPGWWKYVSAKFNPDSVKTAILQSVSESEKFPHAIILVIPIDTSFTNEQLRIIKENMAILGEDVWRHTIVLFTWGDRFSDVSIERHIESEGEALQWLIEKCGNRYHVFDNTDRNNRAQVTELLQKIDEMVAENCLFCLNIKQKKHAAETNLHVTDEQKNVEEISMNTYLVLKLLNEELNKRLKEVKKNGEIVMYLNEHTSQRSFPDRPEFKEGASSELSETLKPLQDTKPAEEKIMKMIEREGSRWESIIIETIRETRYICNKSCDENQIQRVKQKVWNWFQSCDQYSSTSGCETNLSDLSEDPQTPETSAEIQN